MSDSKMTTCSDGRSPRRLFLAGLALALLATPPLHAAADSGGESDAWTEARAALPAPSQDRVIGRVVGLRGTVYAQSPGEAQRKLQENSPIYPGDRLVSSKGAQLGVLGGDYYTGLDEDTILIFEKRGNGPPDVRLERGDVRLINAGRGENAQVATPGLLAANTSRDVRAIAVQEKAWMVSMVCALEGDVEVVGEAGKLVVDEGGCAASKPAEGLFLAGDAAEPAPVAQPVAAAPQGGPAGAAAQRFAVAQLPPVSAPPPGPGFAQIAPGVAGLEDALRILRPCDSPASGCLESAGPLPQAITPFGAGRLPPP